MSATPKSLLKDTFTLTEAFEDSVTNPVNCRVALEVLLFLEWTPGDEDVLDIMPVWSGDDESGDFYRVANQEVNEHGQTRLSGEVVSLRVDEYDESVDGSASSEGTPHFVCVRVIPRGTHAKFLFRCRKDDETLEALSPGTVKVQLSVQR